MRLSEAEAVTAEITREWRALALLAGTPSYRTIDALAEAILTLVSEDLLAGVLGGFVALSEDSDQLLFAGRWSFAHAEPLLRPRWPLLPCPGADVGFVARLRLADAWFRLDRGVRRQLEAALPVSFAESTPPRRLADCLVPVLARRLPSGLYLVLETAAAPPVLPLRRRADAAARAAGGGRPDRWGLGGEWLPSWANESGNA